MIPSRCGVTRRICFHHYSLCTPQQRSGCSLQGGANEGDSRMMFWELAPEDVMGKTGVLNCAKIECEWKSSLGLQMKYRQERCN